MIFPQREPQAEDPARPTWWPNRGREAKQQGLWANEKCTSFTVALQYSKGLNLLLVTCWNRSEVELAALLMAVVDVTHIPTAERAGDGLWRRRVTGTETSRSELEWGLWQHGERARGKSKLAFSNTNRTTEKGRTTKARQKCWQEEGKTSQKAEERMGWGREEGEESATRLGASRAGKSPQREG